MSDKTELFNFEKEIDTRIAQSPIFRLPLRSVLTNFFGAIDYLIKSGRFGRNISKGKADGSDILGTPIKEVKSVSVLLCRSGIGTESVWKLVNDITVLNLQLLNGVIQSLITNDLSLLEFKNIADSLLENIRQKSLLGWEKGDISIYGTVIKMPLLHLNYEEIHKTRVHLSPI